MPILRGSVPGPVEELRATLGQISGAEFAVEEAGPGKHGIYVGLAGDFPWLGLAGETAGLGAEGFVIRSRGSDLLLVAGAPRGAQHAVTTFLQSLGCRWFFPGKTWEVVPRRRDLEGAWEERSVPRFAIQRRIWYGYGAAPECARDMAEWERHNRMGGPLEVSIGHTWYGLDPERDFREHPDWFALVTGARKASKPCFTHPEVLRRAIEYARQQVERGAAMVSLTPPDGLGYCECDRCMAVCQGAKPYLEQSALFARRPDGVVVSVASETLFAFVNRVADALAEKHPGALVGCLTYSAYSHPPSFPLRRNVFVQTTTAFRRTNLTLEQQLDALKQGGSQLGIREYYSVYQWDWDYPDPGKVNPARLQKDLRFLAGKGVTSINAEASNNWGPRGPGYYVAAKLLWDPDADVSAILRDFYATAFGPAAEPMERYYRRWYGAAAGGDASIPLSELANDNARAGSELTRENLQGAYRELTAASDRAREQPACAARVDPLRMYLHYLVLRRQLAEAERAGDAKAILAAIRAETSFGARLTATNMIHTRPLLGKAFMRRFKKDEALLAGVPEAELQGWRREGTPPSRDELDRLWTEDGRALGLS